MKPTSLPTSHSRALSFLRFGFPNVTSFTKPGRPAKGNCVNVMNWEYALTMLGWLPAQPNAERTRRLFSRPALFSTAT